MIGGITHPEQLDGRRIWLDPEVEDLLYKLHFGDPTLGWEGDPRLSLYRSTDKRWELWRLEEDNQYRMVMRSRPQVPLDNRLIMHLVAHDMRRGYNPHTSIVAHNDRLEKERDSILHGQAAAALEKVYWAAGKDVGHLY